jgi:hypothetical protein
MESSQELSDYSKCSCQQPALASYCNVCKVAYILLGGLLGYIGLFFSEGSPWWGIFLYHVMVAALQPPILMYAK